MRTDYFSDLIPAKDRAGGDVPGVPGVSPANRGQDKARHGAVVPGVPGVPGKKAQVVHDAPAKPLATKLREYGLAVGLEVDGQVVAWIFADETAAASRPDLAPAITATEAEALADCDGDSIRAMIELKQALGGRIEADDGIDVGGPVRCADCQHFRRKAHPHLGSCSAGVKSYGAAGLWDNDRRHCTQFREQSAGPAK